MGDTRKRKIVAMSKIKARIATIVKKMLRIFTFSLVLLVGFGLWADIEIAVTVKIKPRIREIKNIKPTVSIQSPLKNRFEGILAQKCPDYGRGLAVRGRFWHTLYSLSSGRYAVVRDGVCL